MKAPGSLHEQNPQIAALRARLRQKPDPQQLASEAAEQPSMLDDLVRLVNTDQSSVKFQCTKIIRMVSEQQPELVYPHFEAIARWMGHNNHFIQWDSLKIIANLVSVDMEDRFSPLFQPYFALVHDPHMVTAATVVENAWKIALTRPHWEPQITDSLLSIPQITYLHTGEPSPECNRIVCGKALESFERYISASARQPEILEFARQLLDCPRAQVAQKAWQFLRRHSRPAVG